MGKGWHTPATLPTSYKCWQVSIPNDEQSEAVFRDAIMQLAHVYNWEQIGGISAQACADLFFAGIEPTLNMNECEGGGEVATPGEVFWFAGDTAPDGSLVCDGQSVETSVYPELFNAVGYEFGGSGGEFNLPNLVDNFIVGSGQDFDTGDVGGAATHQLSVAELPAHTHGTFKQTATGLVRPTVQPHKTLGAYEQSDTAGANYPHENLPPYVALMPCIRT